ncbi:MAG TPA: SH3 domain-containing protein [Burkholderiales bacterium]|nr:SH3 domain-containing protein [Burkholderiales bacterium]
MSQALSWARVLAAVILSSAAASAAAQRAVLERDSPLYAEPRLESARVAELKQGAAAEVTGKQGVWLRVKTPDAAGWLFSFNVRFQSKAGEGGEGGGAALGRLFGPRRSVAVTSTIGIRGLEEEDLRQAKFDAGQMKLLESYAASKEAAERAARAAGLAPVELEYFDGGAK